MSKKADAMMKQRLLAERDRLLKQRDALDNQIQGLERGIALLEPDAAQDVSAPQGRGRVKSLILDLLREAGTTGLNAAVAVEMADRRGTSLGKDSVSSLLSRLKKDDVVAYDGERYRLKEFSRMSSATRDIVQFGDRFRASA